MAEISMQQITESIKGVRLAINDHKDHANLQAVVSNKKFIAACVLGLKMTLNISELDALKLVSIAFAEEYASRSEEFVVPDEEKSEEKKSDIEECIRAVRLTMKGASLNVLLRSASFLKAHTLTMRSMYGFDNAKCSLVLTEAFSREAEARGEPLIIPDF